MKSLPPIVLVVFLLLAAGGASANAFSGEPDFDLQRLQSYSTQELIGFLATGPAARDAAPNGP
jgi:hypothetical protein